MVALIGIGVALVVAAALSLAHGWLVRRGAERRVSVRLERATRLNGDERAAKAWCDGEGGWR